MSNKTPEQKAQHNARRYKKRNPDKPSRGYILSDETRENMSVVAQSRGDSGFHSGFAGHTHTEESKKQISETLTGGVSGFAGHKHDKKTCEQISQTLLNKHPGE
jgi:hypothetical protein